MGEVIDIRAKLERDKFRRDGYTVYGTVPTDTLIEGLDFHPNLGVIVTTDKGIMHCPDGEEFVLLDPATQEQVKMQTQEYDGFYIFT